MEGGPLDGHELPAGRVRGAFGWIDGDLRVHREPGRGRWLYWTVGAVLRFGGHAVRRCGGCGAIIEPHPLTGERLADCPLCGAGDGQR